MGLCRLGQDVDARAQPSRERRGGGSHRLSPSRPSGAVEDGKPVWKCPHRLCLLLAPRRPGCLERSDTYRSLSRHRSPLALSADHVRAGQRHELRRRWLLLVLSQHHHKDDLCAPRRCLCHARCRCHGRSQRRHRGILHLGAGQGERVDQRQPESFPGWSRHHRYSSSWHCQHRSPGHPWQRNCCPRHDRFPSHHHDRSHRGWYCRMGTARQRHTRVQLVRCSPGADQWQGIYQSHL